MSVTVFGARVRSSISTLAVAGLLTAGLAVGSASAATVDPAPAPQGAAQTSASAPAKSTAVQIASTAKAVEISKTQIEAVAKELGAKPSDALTSQLTKYHSDIQAATALTDPAAKTKAVTEARQQLAAIGGKPVTPEQAAKIDAILGVK
ncbi:hypothetical protein D3877_11035 [Azospirillum cavernae]|uniref:Uncharacterized protein n=1 Tax=Azospirillum cavernae TaxID=2320860 RepID=A0A418W4Q2_9PROT|nr:hypothetical protein [Azospirillum cavernae]RJF84985.1 hypothetical protein D3877_11035 [Azospirillum cavernae]